MSLDLGSTALDLPGLPASTPQQPAGPVLPSPAHPAALDLGAQAPPPAPKPKLLVKNPLDPTQFRKFGDSAAIRKAIYDRALDAARNIQPVKNNRYELSLTNVDYADPDKYSLKAQKAALMAGTSIARRLRGTWQLKDTAGQLVQEKHVTLAKVPHFTDRGTFINNGTEYSLTHQLRLRPGVYTRQKENGEIEAHANVVKGPGHTLYLDPASGVFKMGLQQANLPLITVMKALGATDSQLKEAWGEDLYNRNVRKDDPHVIEKLYKKLVPKPLPDVPKAEQLRKVFDTMQIDPDVSKRTLGSPHANMTQDAMLDITKKLIRVSRQEEEPDDRDAMPYQTVHGPEDVIAERIGRARKKLFGLLWKASGTGQLGGQFHNALDDEVRGALLSTKLGQALEEINLMEVYDQQSRVTRMGDGGIASMDSVPLSSRSVHPSQLGFIDVVRTAESGAVGVDLRLASNVIKGPGNKLYTVVKDKDGDEVYKDAMELADTTVAMPGELSTNKKYVSAIRDGKLVNAHRDKVDYEIPDMDSTFSPMANMVPGKSAVKGQRLVMASRMLQQALPLREAEAPFVQGSNRNDSTRGYDEQYGTYAGAVRASQPGRVLKVHEDGIDVQYQDGTKDTIELANNFPFNRKVRLHQTANVQPGDAFDKDHLLATSNFTDKQGAVALGKNLRVAYLPYDGKNWEDAIVISESAAKKFSSEHMYKNEHEYEPTDKRTKAEYLGMFATKYDKTTLAKLDDNGIIKPGTVVNSGDPLILVAAQRERNKKSMVRGKHELYADKSVTWDSEYPGEVTDVLRTDKGAMVTVKAYKPAQVADKLSGRQGDKGVIGGIVPDDQMPHGEDGQPYEILVSPLGLSSRINPSQLVENALGKIAERTGKRFKISDFNGDSLAQFANDQLKQHNIPDKETLIDPRNGSKIKDVATGNRWFMKLHHMADDKIQGRGLGSYSSEESPSGKSEQGDSCFASYQKVQTIQGPMHIGRICEKRLGVQVRTFSEALQEWVYRPIVDWFTYRAKVADLITVLTASGPCEKESIVNKTCAAMYVTKNHNVHTYDRGLVQAGTLTLQDRLVTWGPVPTAHQLALLYGTMLGDATAKQHVVSFEHSTTQLAYINWKKEVLGGLLPMDCAAVHAHDPNKMVGKNKAISKTIHSRVVWVSQDHVTDEVWKTCYTDGVKIVTDEWLAKLTDLSLAVWFLDDGSVSRRKNSKRRKRDGEHAWTGQIATNGFDSVSSQKLCDWLNTRLQTACVVNTRGAINLTQEACLRLRDVVAAWVPAIAIPKSKRALLEEVTVIQQRFAATTVQSVCRLGKVPLRIAEIKPYVHTVPGPTEINVYDFTVQDTHTYVAGHSLVSNSKRIGLLDVHALLSHGATKVLRSANLLRGQANPDYWAQFMAGNTPSAPEVPFVYEKFVNMLKASGMNPIRNGQKMQLMAMTDKMVDEMAGDREIKNADTLDWKTMNGLPGGLFDQSLTGGHKSQSGGGNRWSFIRLHTPMLNPIFEEPARRLLNLTKPKFEQIMKGAEPLGSATGPKAIAAALGAINLDKMLAQTREAVKSTKKTARDDAIRKLGYLKTLKDQDLHPKDWIVSKVPVLPPAFRPISVMGAKKLPLVADANYLYADLFNSNKAVKDLAEHLDEGDLGNEMWTLYNAHKAVVGLGEPVQIKNAERGVTGLLKQVLGSGGPKTSMIQRKLLGSHVDFVGRGVIIPNPDLDMDQVGLPEEQAWSMYAPMLVRRMVRQGMPRTLAMKAVEDRIPLAKKALEHEMKDAVVIYNRAPTLHRYSFMAGKPVITKNKAIELSPYVYGGMGADNDGDAINVHAMVSQNEKEEALAKMLPSKHLFSTSTFQAHQMPTKDYVAGLYAASTSNEKDLPALTFQTEEDALRAYRSGKIGVGRRVNVLEH
jgi:DNA-directed RNA polymerase subunit beta